MVRNHILRKDDIIEDLAYDSLNPGTGQGRIRFYTVYSTVTGVVTNPIKDEQCLAPPIQVLFKGKLIMFVEHHEKCICQKRSVTIC